MFPTASLLTALLLAISIAATPVQVRTTRVSLPLAKRINTDGGAVNLVQHDQARAATLRGLDAAIKDGKLDRRQGSGNVVATNGGVSYTVSVDVGSVLDHTQYNLLVDTGSSNTWVGNSIPYKPTSTSHDTGGSVSVSYGTGSFSGKEYLDALNLGGLAINQQSIGVASTSSGISKGIDGILGIGPVDLTIGTLSSDKSASIPTVTDNLFNQGTIQSSVVSVSFEPPTKLNQVNGELIFGGVDANKYTGEISYTPITSTSPASRCWGIDQSITYGDQGLTIMSETAGIVDTGSTLILLASDAFSAYQSATGATKDAATSLLTLTADQYTGLQSLYFNVNSVTYELTPNGQIWPRSINSYIGGTQGSIYLIVSDIGTPSGKGFDFINGQSFLERFYSVYDTGNRRVGLATTPFTDATTN